MDKYKDVFITTTDTIIGIGVPINKNDGSLIFKLKKRDRSKNLIIAIGSIEQARSFEEWNKEAEKLSEKYWPGQTTLVLSKNLALRIPDSKGLQELLLKKGPCFLTSANISGQEVVKSINEAKKIFPEVKQFYDFGKPSGRPSTIIDVKTKKILR